MGVDFYVYLENTNGVVHLHLRPQCLSYSLNKQAISDQWLILFPDLLRIHL